MELKINTYVFMNDDSCQLGCSKSGHICRSVCDSHQSARKRRAQFHVIDLRLKTL